MSSGFSMDPYQVPPQGLKDIFKDLRSIKNTADSRMAALRVLDFEVLSETDSVARLNYLKMNFECFHSQGLIDSILENPPPAAKFHTVDDVSGVLIFPGILPSTTQRILLERLLHRDLSNPKHHTNLHLHYDVSYPDHGNSFFATSPSDVLFTPKDTSVHKALNMSQALQKKMRWMTLGGQYDWTNKVYPEEPPPEFPSDVGNLIREIFDRMLDPQAAIVNIYTPGDTLSLHRDVSEEVKQPLVSISFGCECLFLIAVEDETSETGFKHATIRLRSGDALVMMGEARFAWHGVPKVFADTCPSELASWPNGTGVDGPYSRWDGWMKNKRVNLNVRQMS